MPNVGSAGECAATLVVVDATGLGAGVVDQLKHRGYLCKEFLGVGRADDPNAYFNKRAEVWGLMREALKSGIELPNNPDWETDLCGVECTFSAKGAIQLEPKESMKARGLASPDLGDALAQTFAVRVGARYQPEVSTSEGYYRRAGEHRWMA